MRVRGFARGKRARARPHAAARATHRAAIAARAPPLCAEFHHAISSDRLMVDRAWTGMHMSSPRLRYHSKGRAGRSHYRTSMLSVRLREMTDAEAAAKRRFVQAAPDAARKAKLDPRAY